MSDKAVYEKNNIYFYSQLPAFYIFPLKDKRPK